MIVTKRSTRVMNVSKKSLGALTMTMMSLDVSSSNITLNILLTYNAKLTGISEQSSVIMSAILSVSKLATRSVIDFILI